MRWRGATRRGLSGMGQRPSLGPGETLDELLADDSFDPDAAARQGRGYERLDQLAVEHLLGAR